MGLSRSLLIASGAAWMAVSIAAPPGAMAPLAGPPTLIPRGFEELGCEVRFDAGPDLRLDGRRIAACHRHALTAVQDSG